MKCRLCGAERTALKWRIERFDKPFDVFECAQCGFQFQDIAPEDAYRFYDEGYYTGGNTFTYLDERRMEEASRIVWKDRFRRWARLDESDSETKEYLDVGCAFGGLMQVAGEFGYVPSGAEVSEYSGGYARQRFGKDRVVIGNIETMTLPENRFSIVSMIEVIEHLADPKRAMENVFRSMQDGGLLVVQTADMAGLQAICAGSYYHYYLPGHLSYFTRRNLEELGRAAGFRKTRFYGGVEFALISKLRKSRANFKKWSDYLAWFRICMYHIYSKITLFGKHWTSSMVMMLWK